MLTILTHTPIWVFPLFLYIAFMTLRATRARIVNLPRLLGVPVMFILWGMSGLLSRHHLDLPLCLTFLAGLGLGAAALLAVGKPVLLGVDRERGVMELAGSWAPFIRVMTLFIAKFTLGWMMALRPDLAVPLAYADAAVSGFGIGNFLLWMIALVSAYTAPLSRPMIQR